jgi:RNase H-fold protein (predicted Holliday junction resolvase)
MTPRVEKFAQQLHAKTSLPVTLQDERLSSREAESRLALTTKTGVREGAARRRGGGRHPAGLS